MSTPIDLDLVELRCKLRGWHCERYDSEPKSVLARTPRGSNILVHEIASGGSWWGKHDTPYRQRVYTEDKALLTHPRLTLADIIADPGEGWTAAVDDDEGGHRFEWRAEYGTYFLMRGATVSRGSDGDVSDAIGCSAQGAERIAAHRAVTDLLIKLAEVTP